MTENINYQKVSCTFSGCGALMLDSSINDHSDVHSDETFKCEHKGCDEVIDKRNKLRKHKHKHLGEFKCHFNTCNFIGDSSAKLKIHKLTHSEERPIKCHYCGKGFKDKYGLQSHFKTTHPEQCHDLPLLVCEVDGCQYQTKLKSIFIRHKRLHNRPFECNVCHKRFSRKKNYEDHKIKHLNDKPFKCDQCTKSFHTPKNLSKHIFNLHKPKTIPCDVEGCEKLSSSTDYMKAHMKTHQDKSKKERVACEWPGCEKILFKSTIEDHMKRHKKVFSYHCEWPECGRSFVTKFELDYHTNRHSDNRPFRCQWPDCDKAYTSCNALSVHTKRHKGYTYSCCFDDCDFKCYDSIQLKKHHKNQHDNFVE